MKFKIFISIIFALIAFAGWFFGGDRNTDKITASQEQKTSSISTISPASAQTKKYENIKYGFSFNYPTDFTLGEFPEDESGVSLIIQNVKTNQVVQIYITPYDDPDFAVSAERVKRDIPDMPFSNSADAVVGGRAKGVAFFSENEAFGGQTAEVWFADGALFFQATASVKDAELLEEIIKSWEFR